MTSILWSRLQIVLILAIVLLAGVAALLAVKLIVSQPFEVSTMGDRWQCSKAAFVITTCTKRPGQPITRQPGAPGAYVDAG